jgi:hypothetical protein
MFDWRLWRWGWVELSMTSFSVNVRVCVNYRLFFGWQRPKEEGAVYGISTHGSGQ